MSKRAVVLAGGLGSRLRPYTVVLPKPLMPVGEGPILSTILEQLAGFGFDHVTLAVNYQADIVKAYCADGARWGIRVDYSLETEPLSTIAPLCLIPDLPEHFLLMNGDVLTDVDFGRLYDTHVSENRLFTISAARRRHVVDYGVLQVEDGKLNGFLEKPKYDYLVSMGVYVVNRNLLSRVPPRTRYGFDHLMASMLADGSPVHVEPFDGYWMDIGRVEDYMQATEEFETMKPRLFHHDRR
jgi:NDP-mannose synthase